MFAGTRDKLYGKLFRERHLGKTSALGMELFSENL